MHTNLLEPLFEPAQPYNHHYDVDEAKIADNGDHIDVDLLIRFQQFDINTRPCQYFQYQRIERPTCSVRIRWSHSRRRRTRRWL